MAKIYPSDVEAARLSDECSNELVTLVTLHDVLPDDGTLTTFNNTTRRHLGTE